MVPSADSQSIDAAVSALRRGEVIGMPTETVYGLAADARNAEAVARIFAIKGRPADHPLIVHVASAATLPDWSRGSLALAEPLAAAFWPGPLTLILSRHPSVLDVVTGGQDSVGLRCPAHPLAQRLLAGFGGGLAAPSANRFGRISPTRAQHVRDEFGMQVPLVLDGGECAVGIESTILDLSSGLPTLLRPGQVTHAQLEKIVGCVAEKSSRNSPRASGTLESHYAPRTRMLLLPRSALVHEADEQRALGKVVSVLAISSMPSGATGLLLPEDPAAYAHGIYAALRELDGSGAHLLLVEKPPISLAWVAVQDRLRRAAASPDIDDYP